MQYSEEEFFWTKNVTGGAECSERSSGLLQYNRMKE
jgi:hypothetical protein